MNVYEQKASMDKKKNILTFVFFRNSYFIYCRGWSGRVDPEGPVSLHSLAPTLIKHTWTS